jgi:hypothetical protein
MIIQNKIINFPTTFLFLAPTIFTTPSSLLSFTTSFHLASNFATPNAFLPTSHHLPQLTPLLSSTRRDIFAEGDGAARSFACVHRVAIFLAIFAVFRFLIFRINGPYPPCV